MWTSWERFFLSTPFKAKNKTGSVVLKSRLFSRYSQKVSPLGDPNFILQCPNLSLTRPRFRLCLLPHASRNVSLKPRFYTMMDQKVSSGTKVVLGLIYPYGIGLSHYVQSYIFPLLCCQLSHALKKMF